MSARESHNMTQLPRNTGEVKPVEIALAGLFRTCEATSYQSVKPELAIGRREV